MRVFLIAGLLWGGCVLGHADEGVVDLDKIIVTPSRYAISDKNLPSNVTVVGKEALERNDTKTVADALRDVGGVYVSDNSTMKTQKVDMRGLGEFAGSNVLVMIDGRKVNPVDISGPDWLQIPTDAIERIEIIRGAGSVLYGDNAPGGVINIITKKSTKGLHGQAALSYGSFDTLRRSLQVSDGNDKVSAFVHVSNLQSTGYRENSHLKAKDALVNIGVTPLPSLKFDLSSNWHEDYYGLPGALLQNEFDQLGRRASVKYIDFGATRDRSISLTTTMNPWKDLGWGKFELNNSYRNRDTYGFYPSQGVDTKYNIDTYGLGFKYILARPDEAHALDLVTGFDYYDNRNRITGGQFDSSKVIVSKDDLGFFANGEYQVWDQFYANAGTRYQRSIYTFDVERDSGGANPLYIRPRPDVQVSRAGVRYQYANNSNAFLDYEQTFRFLATDELYSNFTGINQNLKQQKGDQIQTGLKHDWWDVAQSKVTGYWINTTNEIYFDPTIGGGFGDNNNYDHTYRQGIEFEQSVNIKKLAAIDCLDQWLAGVNYNWQDPQFANGKFKGKRIPMTPQEQYSLFTDIGFGRYWHWRPELQYTGDRYMLNDEANRTAPLKSYTLLNMRLSYRYNDLEVFGQIDNIFAQQYSTSGTIGTNTSNRNYYPAAQRTMTTGVKIKF